MNKISLYLKNIIFSLHILWQASPWLLFSKMGTSALSISIMYIELVLIRNIINVLSNANDKSVFVYISLLCVASLVGSFCSKINKQINYYYEDKINLYLDNILVCKISNMKYSLFDESKTLNKITDAWDLINTIKVLPELSFTFLTGIGKAIVSLIIISHLNIFLCIAVVLFTVVSNLLYKKANELKWSTDRESITNVRMMDYYKECLGQNFFFNLKIFDYASFFIEKYLSVWKNWYRKRNDLAKSEIVLSLCAVLLLSVSEIAVMVLSLFLFIAQRILIGDVIYYFSIVQELEIACEELVFGGSSLIYSLKEITYVRELLDLDSKDELGDREIPETFNITFDGVWFRYPDQEEYVLRDCNFTIEKNEVVGLVGRNGAGKSTIVKLILALYIPCRGRILLNGVNYSEFDVAEIRKKMGVMFQDYNKYSMSVKENIIISEIEEANNTKMLNNAISYSGCDELLSKFNDNIDIQLTKRFDKEGVELSAGQWQKIALARSFFGEKKIYLLDEPSSAMDPITEDKIIQAFEKMVQNSSGIIVTHRLSSICFVDKILVLDEGKIVESGTPEELLKIGGIYASFYSVQAKRYT